MMIGQLSIRQATIDDVNELSDLISGPSSVENTFATENRKRKNALFMLMDNDAAVIYVAEIENRIVGMIIGQLVISTAAGGYSVLLEDLCIMKGLKKRGVRDALLHVLESWGKKKQSRSMQLVTEAVTHQGLAFFRKSGFELSRLKGFCKNMT